MAKKKKSVIKYKKTRHHIIPSSRGGTSKLENISKVPVRDHQYYHALFENKTPEEIVRYLVEDYWNGNWKFVERAYYSYSNYNRNI